MDYEGNSSGSVNLRCTSTWVNQYLIPFGFFKLTEEDTPPEEIVRMKDFLPKNLSLFSSRDTRCFIETAIRAVNRFCKQACE